MSELLAWVTALLLAHTGGPVKNVLFGVDGARPAVAVRYEAAPAAHADALRALFDRDGDGALDEVEGARLADRLVEEATFALRVALDGAPVPLEWRAREAYNVGARRSRDDLPAVSLWGIGPAVLWCGVHRLEVRDQAAGGGVIAVHWPDRSQAVIDGQGAVAWVGWLCPRPPRRPL